MSSIRRREFIRRAALASAFLPIASGAWGKLWTPPESPAFGLSMWTYLWDLVDEGYDAVLGRLKENGLTSVSCAAAYHAGKFLAPHNPKRKIVFLDDGTIYFSPTLSRYGRIRPLVNPLVARGESLGKVRTKASRHGLGTRAWVVCCHNTPLGTRYPDIATETAFGDRLPHNLCPSHPDLRAYLRALVRDIAAQGVDTIELEAMQFQSYAHGMHHEREGIALSLPARFLLGLCFCPACLRRSRAAGVPIDAVRSYTRRMLERLFAGSIDGFPATLADLPADHFVPFFDWREGVVVSLAEELREAVGPAGPALRPLVGPDPIARQVVSMNPGRVGRAAGGIILLAYVKEGSEIRPELDRLREALGGNELRVGMHLGMPETGGKREFLSRMETCRSAGITQFNFYNYGFVPLENLGWIREGIGSEGAGSLRKEGGSCSTGVSVRQN